MNIFTILFALGILVLGILTLIVIPCILWFGRKRSWRFRLVWIGVSCLPLAGFIWFIGWSSGYEPNNPQELARGFAYELHHPLPTGVTDLQIKRVVVGDGVGSFARFEAAPEVMNMLVQDFSPSDKSTFDEWSGGANVPDWWDADSHHFDAYYQAENWEKGCSTFSHAVLAYDRTTRTVFFAHGGS